MTTVRFLARRVVQALVVVLVVTVIVFCLLHALPGGPARGILGAGATAQQIALFEQQNGLDKPLVTQYVIFLGQLLHGDLGTSYTYGSAVTQLIGERLGKTLVLTGLQALVALVVALPLGVWQATRRGKAVDQVLTAVSLVLYATPAFFLGLVLIVVFAQWLPWLPSQAPTGDTVAEVLAEPDRLVLPVLTGAAATIAVFSRYMRSATLETLSEDHVRTARAGGASWAQVLRRHVVRGSLTPVVAMLGYYVPVMFGGSLVVEQLFNYPGMGLLFWNAASSSDFPLLLGCVLVISVATVIGTLLADVLQAVVDPRVKAGAL